MGLKKPFVMVWTGCIWFRTGINSRLLWTR